MSFSKVPFSRFKDRNEQKTTTGRDVTPQDKVKTKPSHSSIAAPRVTSKCSLNKQSISNYTTHVLQQQQQPLLKQQQNQRPASSVAKQCSTLSVEGAKSIRALTPRSPSRSKSRDVQWRSARALSFVSRSPDRPDDSNTSAKIGGVYSGIDGGSNTAARQAQAAAKRRVMETQFTMKSKRFAALRKEVADKQRTLYELHDNLIDIHDRLLAVGVKEAVLPEALPWVEVEEMGLSGGRGRGRRVTSPPPSRPPGSRRVAEGGGEGAAGGAQADSAPPSAQLSAPTEEAMQQLEMSLRTIPHACLEMCRDTLNKRNEVLNWFSELDSSRALLDDEMRSKLEIYRREGAATDSDMEAAHGAQQEAVTAALATLRSLAAAAERARSENEQQMQQLRPICQQCGDVEGNGAQVAELERALAQAQEREQELEAQLADVMTALQDTEQRTGTLTEEVEAERKHYRTLTIHLGSVEGGLKEERVRLRGLETRLAADEARIQQLNAQMSHVEAEQELRLQALADEARAHSDTARLLAAQKEALECRVQDLGALIAVKDGGDMSTLNHINELQQEIHKELEKERELRKLTQQNLEKEQSRILELEEKIQELTGALQTSSANVAKEKSTLAQELETMKKQLIETLKKVKAMEDERLIQEEVVRKLETWQARERDDKQKLNGELQQKAQQLCASEAMLREARDRVAAMERQLATARAARPLEKVLQQTQHDFQKKVTELQEALKEVVRRNEEMERTAAQKQEEVEQRERVMREQGRTLRVRDELIVLLKSKEQRQEETLTALQDALSESEGVQEKINQRLSDKIKEMQRLKEAMEERQLHVTKLETLVKQLEEQQERSQEQRTRQEARISSLEMRLQEQESPPPKRYARPPLAPQTQASYFFWDGQRLNRIECIPPGAAQAPRKGTFYLTVVPKPHANPASDSANVQFYVTANIGEHDVEDEEDAGSHPAEEVLSGEGTTSAAYAVVETDRCTLAVDLTSDLSTLRSPPQLSNAQPVGEKGDAGWTESSLVHRANSSRLATSQFPTTFPQDDRLLAEDLSRPCGCPSPTENTMQPNNTTHVVENCDGRENQKRVKESKATSSLNSYAGAGRHPYQMRPRPILAYATGSNVGFQQSEVSGSYWHWMPLPDSRPVTHPSAEKRNHEVAVSRGVGRLRAGSEGETNPCLSSHSHWQKSQQSTAERYHEHSSVQKHACRSEVFSFCPHEISTTLDINFQRMDEARCEAHTSSSRSSIPTFNPYGNSCSNEPQFHAQFPGPGCFQNGGQKDSFEKGRSACDMGNTPQPHCDSFTRILYPRKYQNESITKQHGMVTTIHNRYYSDERCSLFYLKPDSSKEEIAITGSCGNGSFDDCQPAPCFTFRSLSPDNEFFHDIKREMRSYVTLPGGDYFQNEDLPQQQKQASDIVGSNRLPFRSNPDFQRDGNTMDGGTSVSMTFKVSDQHFSGGVENANEDLPAAAKWTDQGLPVQWGLPTIDEVVNSKSHEQRDSPSQHLTASYDRSRRPFAVTPAPKTLETIVARSTSVSLHALQEATETACTAVPKRDEDGSCFLHYWSSRRAKYSDTSSISIDTLRSPRSTEDTHPQIMEIFSAPHNHECEQFSKLSLKESANRRSNDVFYNTGNETAQGLPRNDFKSSSPQNAFFEEHVPLTLEINDISPKDPQKECSMYGARNLKSSSNFNKEQLMLHLQPKVKKHFTVVTNGNGSMKNRSNLHLDTSLQTNSITSHKSNHRFLNKRVFKHATNVSLESWNDGNNPFIQNSFF